MIYCPSGVLTPLPRAHPGSVQGAYNLCGYKIQAKGSCRGKEEMGNGEVERTRVRDGAGMSRNNGQEQSSGEEGGE